MVVYIYIYRGTLPNVPNFFRKIRETSIDSNSIKFLGFRFQLFLLRGCHGIIDDHRVLTHKAQVQEVSTVVATVSSTAGVEPG